MKPDGAGNDEIQGMLEKLSREIKSLQKEIADIRGSQNQELQEEEQPLSVSTPEETPDDAMNLLGIDDDFADTLLGEVDG